MGSRGVMTILFFFSPLLFIPGIDIIYASRRAAAAAIAVPTLPTYSSMGSGPLSTNSDRYLRQQETSHTEQEACQGCEMA